MGWFDWLRRPRPALPDSLWSQTLDSLPFLAALSDDEKQRLRLLCERFLATKEFSAAGGLQLDDRICLSIAAQACLPILELGLAAYADWVGIIVYPDEFIVQRRIEDDDGVIHEFADVLSGEAWEGGPVLISWHDAQMAGDGYNVVIHEFAHKLDMLNGSVDGIPALHTGLREEDWIQTLDAAWENFCQRVDDGEDTWIDPYASESPEEFFAVLSECFFERPDVVMAEYPALYALFRRYYRQDPLQRLGGSP